MLSTFPEFSLLTTVAHVLIATVISARVIMKRPAIGVAMAWLLLIVSVPFVGAMAYLLIGERRINANRARRLRELETDKKQVFNAAVNDGLMDVDWSRHEPVARSLDTLARRTVGTATLQGSRFELFSVTHEILDAIAKDVDAAEQSVLMEFYIWSEGGQAEEVLEALIRAAKRGVSCRLLVDALGARPWWKGKQPQRLRDAGVQVLPALPVGVFRAFLGRTDLRLHRKIVVIDSNLAWTGSMNLVDPRFFKQDSGVGQWVDAMVRLRGSTVAALAATMIGDWMLETSEPLEKLIEDAKLKLVAPDGPADILVVPSGPQESKDGLLQMILALVSAAQEELVMTTPYLVPDESLLRALRGAAGRGVKVRLILPEKVDSFLTRNASRSYYDDLLEVGVEIHLYRGGLLHTKSITADSKLLMFGTANLDMRSMWLNYEVSLFASNRPMAEAIRALQGTYIADSDLLDPDEWARRPWRRRLLENSLRLLSPLL